VHAAYRVGKNAHPTLHDGQRVNRDSGAPYGVIDANGIDNGFTGLSSPRGTAPEHPHRDKLNPNARSSGSPAAAPATPVGVPSMRTSRSSSMRARTMLKQAREAEKR